MKSFFSILISLMVLCVSTPAKTASPNPDNCDYYLDKEKETGCFVRNQKDSDYLVKYGYRYCSLFKSRLTDWKDERKDWVKKTTKCLQTEVEKTATPIDCPQLEDGAFDSHPGCYRKSGFCELKFGQKSSIVWAAIGADTLLSPKKSFYQGFVLLGDCLKGIPAETAALYNRSIEVAKLDPSLRLPLTEAFDLARLSDQNQKIYSKRFYELLISNNKKINPDAYAAYTSIYGQVDKPTADFNDLQTLCFVEKRTPPGFCKEAERVTGSKLAFKSLRNIPTKVDLETLRSIIKFRSQLESMK